MLMYGVDGNGEVGDTDESDEESEGGESDEKDGRRGCPCAMGMGLECSTLSVLLLALLDDMAVVVV